jgi:hypothetical protein
LRFAHSRIVLGSKFTWAASCFAVIGGASICPASHSGP